MHPLLPTGVHPGGYTPRTCHPHPQHSRPFLLVCPGVLMVPCQLGPVLDNPYQHPLPFMGVLPAKLAPQGGQLDLPTPVIMMNNLLTSVHLPKERFPRSKVIKPPRPRRSNLNLILRLVAMVYFSKCQSLVYYPTLKPPILPQLKIWQSKKRNQFSLRQQRPLRSNLRSSPRSTRPRCMCTS